MKFKKNNINLILMTGMVDTKINNFKSITLTNEVICHFNIKEKLFLIKFNFK